MTACVGVLESQAGSWFCSIFDGAWIHQCLIAGVMSDGGLSGAAHLNPTACAPHSLHTVPYVQCPRVSRIDRQAFSKLKLNDPPRLPLLYTNFILTFSRHPASWDINRLPTTSLSELITRTSGEGGQTVELRQLISSRLEPAQRLC